MRTSGISPVSASSRALFASVLRAIAARAWAAFVVPLWPRAAAAIRAAVPLDVGAEVGAGLEGWAAVGAGLEVDAAVGAGLDFGAEVDAETDLGAGCAAAFDSEVRLVCVCEEVRTGAVRSAVGPRRCCSGAFRGFASGFGRWLSRRRRFLTSRRRRLRVRTMNRETTPRPRKTPARAIWTTENSASTLVTTTPRTEARRTRANPRTIV